MKRSKELAVCGMLTALAIILSIVERMFPLDAIIPIPGVKLGPTFSFGKNTFTGTLSTYVDPHDALEDKSFTGRIILYQNGKEIAEQPLEYRISDGEYGSNIYDTEVRLGAFEGRMSDFSIKVEITDAYGRVFTADLD